MQEKSRDAPQIIMPLVMYRHACPNCNGTITSDRLYLGLPCHRCLPDDLVYRVKSVSDLIQVLHELGTLRGLKLLENFLEEYRKFEELFERAVNSKMWGAQRLWARRLVKGKSFAIIAPTGSGKTTFGIIASIYIALRGGKVLFVLPTSLLADQVYKKALGYVTRLGLSDKVRVVTYNSLLSRTEREESLSKIQEGSFDILVVTNMFLSRYFDVLKKHRFSLVFVDDVDSVLKASSKNIDRLLLLLGVPEEALQRALKIVELLREARRLRRVGASEEKLGKIFEEVRRLEEEIRDIIKTAKIGVLIASGALVKARRSSRIRLFREFLGFETGGKTEGIRNVVDLYTRPERDILETVVKLVKRLRDGGIIYVPTDLGKDYAKKLEEVLSREGFKVHAYLRPRRGVLDRFSEGKIDLLIGLATARSALVRGIDLPHRVKYVIFAGVPKLRFRINLQEFAPGKYISLFLMLRRALSKEEALQVERVIARLRTILGIQEPSLKKIVEHIERGEEDKLTGFEKYAASVIKAAIELARKYLTGLSKNILDKLDVKIEYEDGTLIVTLPDTTTYIQGSGRTSRMYAGGVTRGISIVVVDDEKVFQALVNDLKYRIEDLEFKNVTEVNLDELIREINEERERVKKILRGEIKVSAMPELLRTVLIVVESPTKARTIAGFFGRPSLRVVGNLQVYEASLGNMLVLVTATRGHMWELVPETPEEDLEYVAKTTRLVTHDAPEDYFGVLKIGNLFVPVYNTLKKCPRCGESYSHDIAVCQRCGTPLVGSDPVIQALRDLASEVDLVLIGTDPDSEGEKIAWDVYVMLRPYVQEIGRIEFHEVTKRAILEAISNPLSGVRREMVMAQIIRRVEDRWLGFGLSQKLWKVSPLLFGRLIKTLSAGRVQTPVLGWIIKRYSQSRKEQVYSARVKLENGLEIDLEIPTEKKALVKDVSAKRARVIIEPIVEDLEETVNPPPPYTTDTLLRDAATRLRISVEEAMSIAQELFESGLITYHRTDSTRVSAAGIAIAREYIAKNYGEQEFVPRQWIIGGHIGAHECIRPTRPIDVEELRALVVSGVIQVAIRLTPRHLAMYDLIFRRFIASQMRPARVRKSKYRIVVTTEDGSERHEIEIERITDIVEEGFLRAYRTVDVGLRLPAGVYRVVEILGKVRRIPKVKPMTEGEVVSEMKQRGIGRPSTYARIVDVILRRRYALTVGKTRYLIPTRKGIKVYYFLTGDSTARELLLRTRKKEEQTKVLEIERILPELGRYRELVSEERTRLVQQLMDEVEVGEKDYLAVLNDLFREAREYGLFEKINVEALRSLSTQT